MKNKKTIYILLPLVILIWLIIGYRIYATLHKKGESLAVNNFNKAPVLIADTVSLHYDLLLDYKDPFQVGKRKHQPSPPVFSAIKKEPAAVDQKKEPVIDIQYLGMIENPVAKTRVAMLRIDGKSLMLQQGVQYDSFYIKEISKNSIRLKLGEKLINIDLK